MDTRDRNLWNSLWEIHFKNTKFTSHLTENMPRVRLSAVARCEKFQYVHRSPGIWQTLFENAHALPACPPYNISVTVKMNMEHWWNDPDRGKPKYCPSVTQSTTDTTWTGQGWNSTQRHGRPETDSLNRSSKYLLIHSRLISQKTHSFSITKSNQPMLLNLIINAHCDNYTTAIHTLFGQNVWAVFTVHAGGSHCDRSAFNPLALELDI
jgi:hypothetical protein